MCRSAPLQVPTKISVEYADFAFFLDLVFELSKRTRINDHTIKLVNGQQPSYGPILSLGPVDPEGLY